MSIGIMQPYFFPYPGYFSLIKNTDRFVLFDTPQFIKHGWVNRNRVSKPDGEWHYIIAPIVKQRLKTPINQTLLKNSEQWQEKILAQLTHFKKRAPNYQAVIDLLKDIFNYRPDELSEFNRHSLVMLCEYLGIQSHLEVFSQMNLELPEISQADEWALQICLSLGESHYLNPEGGLEFFDREKYNSHNIDISFMKFNMPAYNQKNPAFEPGMSVIDLLMFVSPQEANEMLDDYELL